MITVKPTAVALAISHAYGGTCRPQPLQPVRWAPCPACGLRGGPQYTICPVCDGARRIAVMEVR